MVTLAWRVALISMFSAVTVASNYALLPFFQIKLMDPLVFVSAYLLGFWSGCCVAALTWLVYGTVNPLGSAGFPLLLILMVGEMIYAAFGSLLSRSWNRYTDFKIGKHLLEKRMILGVLGLISAVIYDVWTNAINGLLVYQSIKGVLVMILSGIYFAIIHEVADFLLFFLVVPLLIVTVNRSMRYHQ